MTYNILFGGVGRESLIRDVVSAVDPDVVVFTEVTSADSFEAIADVVGPYRAGVTGRGSREHPAIVSRWPIIHSDLLGPPWAPRKWVEATLQPFGGPRVTIVGVQLVPQPLWPFEIWRRAEVRSLLHRLRARAGTPQVIAGDFNTLMVGDRLRREGAPLRVRAQWAVQGGWPRWALRELTDAGYTDCYRACHEREAGFTVPAWNPGVRIDYVFASSNLQRSLRAAGTFPSSAPADSAGLTPRRSLPELLGWKAVRCLGHEASDHLPVWADFEWPSADDAHSTPVEANNRMEPTRQSSVRSCAQDARLSRGRMNNRWWPWPGLAVAALLGCHATGPPAPPVKSYLVTERTIDVGLGPGLCVAVDLGDPTGVWWWEPGSSGCASRSTGPGLFRPQGATVRPSTQSGVHEVGFRLGTHSPTRPFVDVQLLVDSGTLRVAGTTAAVRLVTRSDLEIPEKIGRGGAG